MLISGISQIIGIPWCRWCCWWCGFPDGWCRVLICMMMGFHKSWWCGFQNRDDLADDVDGWWRASICMMMGFHKSWRCGFRDRDDRADDVDSLMTSLDLHDDGAAAGGILLPWASGSPDSRVHTYIAHHPFFWIPTSANTKQNQYQIQKKHLYRPPPLLSNLYKRTHKTKSISKPLTLISPTTPSFESAPPTTGTSTIQTQRHISDKGVPGN